MLVHMFICPNLHVCMLYAMLSMPRSTFSICCLSRSTCSYACSHAYMFISTCLGFYDMFPMFCSSFCSMLMSGLCSHMLDTMSMVMVCSNLCVCMLFAMFCAQIRFCTCLYVWIHVLSCLCVQLLHAHTCFAHAYAQIYVYVLRSMFSHVRVLRSRFFTCLCAQTYALHALCYIPCAHVLHVMFCAQTQVMFVMPCAIIALLLLCLSFLCFGHLVGFIS